MVQVSPLTSRQCNQQQFALVAKKKELTVLHSQIMKKIALTLLLSVLLISSLALLVIVGNELYKTRNHLAYIETRLDDNQQHLDRLKKDVSAKEEYLEKLLTDDIFLERVVRERLGYVNPEEQIFRFPKDENKPSDTKKEP